MTMKNINMFDIEEDTLPRSIRWKIQLGLLNAPKFDIEERKENNNACLDNLTKVEGNEALISSQRAHYSILSKQYEKKLKATKKELNLASKASEQSTQLNDLADDPLTAIVKRQDAFEHRAAARNENRRRQDLLMKKCSERPRLLNKGERKKSHETSEDRLDVIQKDIKRIDPEHSRYYHDRINEQLRASLMEELYFEEAVQMRNTCLQKILFIYAEEHGVYFQGFHEICSYIMLVVEMDLFEREKRVNNDGHDFDSKRRLLNQRFLYHDTYILFETIMGHLLKCYEDSYEISNSVVSKIPYVACDKELYNLIQSIPIEHETYCSRWIRLMMSREVDDIELTLELWDTFLDLITKEPNIVSRETSYYEQLGTEEQPFKLGKWELAEVLEVTAASLIWLKRDELLAAGVNDALEILLDSQPLQDIDILLETLLDSLNRLQSNQNMAPVSLPNPSRRDSVINLKSITNYIMPSFGRSISSESTSLDFEDKICGSRCSIKSVSSMSSEYSEYRRLSSISITKRKKIEDVYIFDKFSESSEHRGSFQRDRSIQRLVDASTCVSTLIEDSDDSENGSNYDSSDDMTSSVSSFAIDELVEKDEDEKNYDSSFKSFFSQEEGEKLSKTKPRSSSFAIDELVEKDEDEKNYDSSFKSFFSQEEGAKLSKTKRRSCVYPDELLPESFQLIDDPICEQELQPIGPSKNNITYEKHFFDE